MNTKAMQERKQSLALTEKQGEIITGLLLGDGHLETQNNGKTYRLKVEHGALQRDYVEWLFDEFREWIPASEPYMKTRKNGVVNYGFTTYSHDALRFYGLQFYKGRTKVIPKLLEQMLTPLSLAIWFMDDGSRKSTKHRTYIIHSLGYSKEDLTRVQEVLRKKCGLKVGLHLQKERYWRLYIPSASARTFELLISGYVRPIHSMDHKLVTHA